MKEFTDSLDSSEIEGMNYVVDFVSNNVFIINYNNDRIFKFNPIFEYDNDKVKVRVTTLDDVNLMDVILPSANYSDAVDSLLDILR
jgi:hypothetical protein